MITVELNFKRKLLDLEMLTNRRWKYTEIADSSDLSRQTITKLFDGHANAIDLKTLGKLLTFFEAHGMPLQVGDLFIVSRLN